jgi:hypothetical protein
MKIPLRDESDAGTDPDVEVWDDPVWRPALDALEGWQPDGQYTGRPDPAPLARLLRSGIPVPEAVSKRLGEFLYPPWGEKGPHLILKLPKKYSGDKNVRFIKEMLSLKKEIENELGDPPNVEAAVAVVAKRTGRSRSHLMKAWTWNLQKTIQKTIQHNPLPILSPREPGES